MSTRARSLARSRRVQLTLQLLVTGFVLPSSGWVVADAAKRAWAEGAHLAILPWTRMFHHPADAALLPYVAASLAALAYGLALYVGLGDRKRSVHLLRRARLTPCGRSITALVAVLVLQVIAIVVVTSWLRLALVGLSVLACLAPVPRGVTLRLSTTAATHPRAFQTWFSIVCGVGSIALLVALAVEPIKMIVRPARLMNEFRELPSQLKPWDRAAHPGEDGPHRFAAPSEDDRARDEEAPPPPAGSDDLCEFINRDPVEFAWQSNTRGPVNHIGHVLNPINELETGKRLRHIYFQYGVGATLALKATMDLAGGTSYQAWRYTYVYYLLYWALFAAAALVLLRDPRYVLAALGLLAASYYNLGYIALMIAPGVNPILHLLDLAVLLLALSWFRTGRAWSLAGAAFGAGVGVLLNGFFGPMVALALAVSVGLRVLEEAAPGQRLRRLAAAAAVVAAPVLGALVVLPRSAGGVKVQFVLGYFAYLPSPVLVLLALAYLAASYLFLVWMRKDRDPLKYAVVFLFVYVQGFLVYFFWSGLENHWWPVLPYLGLHVVLMLHLLARGTRPFALVEPWLLVAAIAGIAVLTKMGVDQFVQERAMVREAFVGRETWQWPFERAQVLSTADPAPLAETLAQLERHPSPDRSVYLLSTFDKLVPFLARRHTAFPHFELGWSILTVADRQEAIREVARARPEWLFVGREVEQQVDGWEGLPCSHNLREERISALGRARELRRVFDAVAGDYERLEVGPLLSVYRRRDAGGAPSPTLPAAAR